MNEYFNSNEKMMETIGTFEPTAAAAKKSMSRAESRIGLALQQGSQQHPRRLFAFSFASLAPSLSLK